MDDQYDQDEILLTNGRLTEGVVKIGETVRRPLQHNSNFTKSLLDHLEKMNFQGSPKHLGFDQNGREVLEYIEGWVPEKFQQFTDEQIHEAGKLLREFHSASMKSSLTGIQPVVCHHDPGPNNTVFQDGRPVAFIDYDLAAPGDPMEDLGYMAWTWCVSSKPSRGDVSEQARQVRILVDSYGLGPSDRIQIVDAMINRQKKNVVFWENYGGSKVNRLKVDEYIKWTLQEKEFTEVNRPVFLQFLK